MNDESNIGVGLQGDWPLAQTSTPFYLSQTPSVHPLIGLFGTEKKLKAGTVKSYLNHGCENPIKGSNHS